ncbi:MAG: YgjV family protein [Firmicutes bacterium]|nr:YgjV family protein [Bacillota bacterium]
MNALAQLISVLAIFCWIISIQNKKKENIIVCQLSANTLYSIQYFLLNVYGAAFMNIISAIRSFVFYDNEKNKRKNSSYILAFFLVAILITGLLTFDGIISLIPIVITLAYTYSVWQNNLNITRYIFLISAFIWIFYNIKVGAHITVLGNILEIISGIISIIRFRGN